MKQPRFSYIYGLKDPTDGQIHYIGKSNDPERRLQEHIEDTTTNPVRVEWIEGLLSIGLGPELVILEKVMYSEWRESEIYWIARGHEEGWPLTNVHPGGCGGMGTPKPPNYDFMRPFLGDVWQEFNKLTISEKDHLCLSIAQQATRTAGYHAPFALIQRLALSDFSRMGQP